MTQNRHAFEELFDQHYERCVRAARRISGDSAIAEELAAEAFARAWARWQRLGQDPQRAVGWLWKVTVNLSIDATRRRAPAPKRPASYDDDATAIHVALVEALKSLPTRQRQVVVLRYLADLPETQVAAVLGVSAGTVKTHLHRGLARLRSGLGTDEEVEKRLVFDA